MARIKRTDSSFFSSTRSNKKRKGVHAKSKSSSNKKSRNYRKKYVGQGR